MARLVGVERRYVESQTVALAGISVDIFPGEFVVVTGRSGSGKSTLLNILGLLDQPTAGIRVVADAPVDNWSDKARSALRARYIGFVFQDAHLVPTRSVTENIELALRYAGTPRNARKKRATEMIDAVGLSHRAHARPTTLSSGERQRVALARSLCHNPSLLLCDEPTGNLDTTNADLVVNLLRTVPPPECAVVVVTHDPGIASHAPRTIELSDGRILADNRRSEP